MVLPITIYYIIFYVSVQTRVPGMQYFHHPQLPELFYPLKHKYNLVIIVSYNKIRKKNKEKLTMPQTTHPASFGPVVVNAGFPG